jgi:TPR repeat protein
VRLFQGLIFLGMAAVLSPCAAEIPAPSTPAKECLRLDAVPADEIPWDEHERVYQHWAEICQQALAAGASDIRVKKATARAFGATGQRAKEIALLREMAAQNDADSYLAIYDMYKSYYRSDVTKPQLVGRAEAERSLRRAAELGHPFATMMLAVLLDRGSTVKRDPEEAIQWAERAVANPARSADPIKDVQPIEMQVLLGRLLVKSDNPAEKARGIELLEKLAEHGRGDAKSYLASAIRATDPVRARKLLEEGLHDYAGSALPPLADMLIKGEGGPPDPDRAVSLLKSRWVADVPGVKGALGQLYIEGKLVPRDLAEGAGLLRNWAVWDYDARLELMGLLAAHPELTISYPSDVLYDATEAAELGEPGAVAALIELKLSQNAQFHDKAGGCALVKREAKRGDKSARQRLQECRAD